MMAFNIVIPLGQGWIVPCCTALLLVNDYVIKLMETMKKLEECKEKLMEIRDQGRKVLDHRELTWIKKILKKVLLKVVGLLEMFSFRVCTVWLPAFRRYLEMDPAHNDVKLNLMPYRKGLTYADIFFFTWANPVVLLAMLENLKNRLIGDAITARKLGYDQGISSKSGSSESYFETDSSHFLARDKREINGKMGEIFFSSISRVGVCSTDSLNSWSICFEFFEKYTSPVNEKDLSEAEISRNDMSFRLAHLPRDRGKASMPPSKDIVSVKSQEEGRVSPSWWTGARKACVPKEDFAVCGLNAPQDNLDHIDCSLEASKMEKAINTFNSTWTSPTSVKGGTGKPFNARCLPLVVDREVENENGDGDHDSDNPAMNFTSDGADQDDFDGASDKTDGIRKNREDTGRENYGDQNDGSDIMVLKAKNESHDFLLEDNIAATLKNDNINALGRGLVSLHGFQVHDSFVPYLNHIHSIEGAFWDVGHKRKATISYFLTSIGEVMAFLDKQNGVPFLRSRLVATRIADALQAGFKVNCLKPMMERAEELLAFGETQSQYELMRRELSSLESRIASLRENLGDLARKMRSKEIVADMKALADFYY